ncbi:MAG: UDP-N-acetylglucosamine 2-epimerase (non-hydrolyzing) [Chloroflexi bacterium]|nr:UDP-N-acetylglucosamine 2-epimerase (non-hydrolyzing) [Chloroflexota bacterium]MBI3741882.1 UDP-N-acetylglucosamine 2-epimerase (non-hydrolyzing) [Chloroflexota bacterium]
MKIVSIVGARPQFIKVAVVSRVLREQFHEVILNTGQHYDDGMSGIFFRELGISNPDYNLGVGSGSHAKQTGEMLAKIEAVLLKETPDWVLVYGDTNSTLAGALAAAKLHVPVAHVEAGLRSYNRAMPEEINRIATDHISDLLFCPTFSASEILRGEGISRGVYVVGDVMYDAVMRYLAIAEKQSRILEILRITPKKFLLATIHRPSNTDNIENLREILCAFGSVNELIVFPVHPRTRKAIEALGTRANDNVRFIEPVGYLDMLWLEKNARLILTDSGGLQKEAYAVGVPCITLRTETEWIETVKTGWNAVVGTNRELIVETVKNFVAPDTHPDLFGDGHASEKIATHLLEFK